MASLSEPRGTVGTACAPSLRVMSVTPRIASRELMERFYTDHEERALRIASSMVRSDPAAIRDVVHDAFLRAFANLGTFRGDASESTWMSRIVVNEAARNLRKQAHLIQLGDEADRPCPVASRDPALQRRIQQAIEGLSGPQRDIFLAVHSSEFTVRETAELIGKAPGTVRTHLQRALIRLRASLGDVATEILWELNSYSGGCDGDAASTTGGSTWL